MSEDAVEPVFRVRSGAATDTGHFRRHNEDAYLAARPIFLVADGMGGHHRGDAASAEAVRHFEVLAGRDWVGAHELHEAMSAAASGISALASDGPAPGTTLAGVALTSQSGRAYWLAFNVGDSRVYLLRNGEFEQVSVDHSRRQELLEAGVEPEAIRVGRNVITRALGAGRPGVPLLDQWLLPAQEGDRVLVCSDGLTTDVSDPLILATLRSAPDPQDAARALVAAALNAAGRDNVTAVVVDAVEVTTLGPAGEPDDEDTLNDVPSFALDDTTEDLSHPSARMED